MPYTKTTWVDNTTPAINASNLNKLENGVYSSSQFFNPKDSAYGAVGDGSTDDTTAIQNCSNDAMAVNGVVVFPPGTYVVNTILPGNNFHWWSPSPQSVTIQHKTGAYRAPIDLANTATLITNFSVENIKFLGNGQDAVTTVSGTQVLGAGGNLNVVNGSVFNTGFTQLQYEPDNFNSTNNRVFNFTTIVSNQIQGVDAGTYTNGVSIHQPAEKMGIYLGGVDGCVVRGCWFENFYGPGVMVSGFKSVLIENNRVYNTCQIPNVANGITLQNTTQSPTGLTDFIIRGNIVDTGSTGGIVFTDSSSTNANVQVRGIIANNIVKNWPNWSGIDSESGYVEQMLITGNVVRACKIGIECVESEGVYSGISNSNRIIVSHNMIDCGPTITNATGISCTGSDLSFIGNVIRASGTGVILGSATGTTVNENVSVVGNTIIQRPNDISTNGNGISLTSNARNVVISGNNMNRMNCRARGAQTGVTTLAVDNVTDWPSTGTIRINGGASAVTYTSITQATRAGGGATINGLSASVTVSDGQLVHLNTAGRAISVVTGDDILISGNAISNSALTGVYVGGGVSRCAITHNNFLNCGTDQNASNLNKSCITLTGGSNSDNQIFGNIMQDPNAITGVHCYIDQSSNTQVRDNYVNNGSGTYNFAFVATTASDIVMDRNNRWGNTHVANGGVFSSTPGAVTTVSIPHKLLTTPTLFTADRGSANSRGAPAYHVTADATNVILTFASSLTAATIYVWNWTAYV